MKIWWGWYRPFQSCSSFSPRILSCGFFFVNLIYSFAKKKAAAQNPWGVGATTLEWTVPSPPNFHTFDELPKFEDEEEVQKSHS